jgi:hypothetical protein
LRLGWRTATFQPLSHLHQASLSPSPKTSHQARIHGAFLFAIYGAGRHRRTDGRDREWLGRTQSRLMGPSKTGEKKRYIVASTQSRFSYLTLALASVVRRIKSPDGTASRDYLRNGDVSNANHCHGRLFFRQGNMLRFVSRYTIIAPPIGSPTRVRRSCASTAFAVSPARLMVRMKSAIQ